MSSIASSTVSQFRPVNSPAATLIASAKDSGGLCPANITLENGQVLHHAGDIKLSRGTAYLFVDGSPGIGKDEKRQTYLYAGERVFALGSYSGKDIGDMKIHAQYRNRTISGEPNQWNGAGGLHNEILKQAGGANYAMAVKQNSSAPQISVPLQTDSMFPGDKDAVLSTATNLGLAPESGKSSILVPNNEFGGGAFVMMYEAKMENAQKRGQNLIRSKVSDLVPNASPAFYKGAQDAYRQVQIGNFLRLGEAALGVLGASKMGMLGYRNATRPQGSPKLSHAPRSIPGGFGGRQVGNNRVPTNPSTQQKNPNYAKQTQS